MRRTFGLDLLTCARCGGRRKVLAAVTDRDAIDAELVARGLPTLRATRVVPRGRGPPRQALLDFAA